MVGTWSALTGARITPDQDAASAHWSVQRAYTADRVPFASTDAATWSAPEASAAMVMPADPCARSMTAPSVAPPDAETVDERRSSEPETLPAAATGDDEPSTTAARLHAPVSNVRTAA